MCDPTPQPPVYAVSWVYWNGEDQGGGGFTWFYRLADARAAFEFEKGAWGDSGVRVRLVPVSVPTGLVPGHECRVTDRACDPCKGALTDWLDANIDDLEAGLPALAVHISDGREVSRAA